MKNEIKKLTQSYIKAFNDNNIDELSLLVDNDVVLIDPSNKIEGKETVGIFNTDGDCYSKMGLLINPALEFLHQYDQEKSLLNSNYDLKLFKNGFSMREISEYFFGFKLRINRNLSDHPYNPHCSKEARNVIKMKILKELKVIYPKGIFYELFDNDQSENNEKFNYLKEILFDKELNLLSSGCKFFYINFS